MKFNILSTAKFDKQLKRLAKKYPSIKLDLTPVLSLLEEKPEQGVSLGNNSYKIRVSIKSKGKGKSGGARLITHIHIVKMAVILLTIYDKVDKENLDDGELDDLLKLIE